VITICAVIAVAFLIALIVQLRRTAKEGEETLVELRDLIENLRETDKKVNDKIDDLTPVIEATKTTAARISDIAWLLTARVFKPSSKYWPYIFPILRLGWRHMKKKGGKNVKR
jgi:hypothetical protein